MFQRITTSQFLSSSEFTQTNQKSRIPKIDILIGAPQKKVKLNIDDLNLERSSSELTLVPSPSSATMKQFENNEFNCVTDEPKFLLPFFSENAIQYITGETLINNIHNPNLILYDCRYAYEFDGGHIVGAEHLNSQTNLNEKLFSSASTMTKIVVLYCEFSLKRSVDKYLEIRKIDRSLNSYPNLCYNNLFVLEQGFSRFFTNHSSNCVGNYVQMNDPQFETLLEEEQSKCKLKRLSRKNTLTIQEFKNLQFKL